MVTPNEYIKDDVYGGAESYFGLSTDTKPSNCGNGSSFIEMDSGKIYFYDATSGDWLEWGASS